MRKINIVNKSSVVTPAAFAAAVAACQVQVTRDFAPIWNMDALVIAAPADVATERILVLDTSDQAGALGYHDLESDVPIGYVFAKTTIEDGDRWEATLSHELLEQLLDPDAIRCAQAKFKNRMSMMALEACDPVENDEYGINGVPVSNFITPEWFLNSPPAGKRLDFMGKLSKPLTMSPGGYILYAQTIGVWKSVFGKAVPKHQRKAHPMSRRSRRL